MIFNYIEVKNENKKTVRACFRKEIHIVDDLKINMFIENDVMKSKDINVLSNKKIAYIKSCKIIVSVKIRSFEILIIKSVHLRKITLIFFHSKISMKINHLIVFNFRDFFKFDEINLLIVYAHLVNAFTNEILFQNEFNRFIKVLRNYRLERFIKLKYINVYHISNENDFKN